MNSNTRNFLRAQASKIKPTVTIGKQGLSDEVIAEINAVLDAKELVKITVLRNSLLSPREVLESVAEALEAEQVQVIGYKVVLYRRSNKQGIEHINLP